MRTISLKVLPTRPETSDFHHARLLLPGATASMDGRHEKFARMTGIAPRIETCWALLGPSRRVLTCGIYRTDVGLEIRVGYGDRMHLYSKNEIELTAAREAAMQLRDAVNDAEIFAEMFD